MRFPFTGVIPVEKPIGVTSRRVVDVVGRALSMRAVGHAGTLDPLATGVLPLCFGAATKFSQIHLDADKAYEAVAKMGQTTSTGDAEGEVLAQCEATFSPDDLRQVEQTLSGPIQQTPPMHSALKKDGKALYEYAREGVDVERTPRRVNIYELQLSELPAVDGVRSVALRARCSKGTYIRTFGEDIGVALGCGAFLSFLRRVQSGVFHAKDCVSLTELEQWPEDKRHAALLPVDALLDSHQAITLQSEDAGRFLSGLRRRGDWPDHAQVAVYGSDPHSLLGTAHVRAGELIPERLLNPQEIQSLLESAA